MGSDNSKQIIPVPDLGGAENVEVIEILVSIGDTITIDDSIVTLESDKASMEVPSPLQGKVTAIKVKLGDKVNEEDPLIELITDKETTTEPQEVTEVTGNKTDKGSAPAANTTGSADDITATATAKNIEIRIPDIGTDNAEVIEVLINVGDELEKDSPLAVLESDKASLELPSPFAGKVVAVHLQVGDKVSEGHLAATVEGKAPIESTTAVSKKQTPPAKKPGKEQLEIKTTASTNTVADTAALNSNTSTGVYAGPAVRKLARELNIDLSEVKATGPRGRLQKDDLHNYIKEQLAKAKQAGTNGGIPKVPAIDFTKFGEIELEPLSKIARVTAENMHRSWLNVPHVTQFDEADLSAIDKLRKSLKKDAEKKAIKLTPLAFLLKASAIALQEHPKFNSALHNDGQHIVRKKYCHIGIAVDTPNGLMVPVVRDADKKDIWQLAKEVIDLSSKAREGKLTPAQLQGGCFTISSLGTIGGQGFTPIINTPEVAILGVSKAEIKPIWNGKEFTPQNRLPLSLSYDHRAINGADAGRFLTFLGETIASIDKHI